MQKTFGYKTMIWRGCLITLGCLATAWALTQRFSEHRHAAVAPVTATWRRIGEDPWTEFVRLLQSQTAMMPVYISGRIRLVNDRNEKVIEEQPFVLESRDSLSWKYRVSGMEVTRDVGVETEIDHEDKIIRVCKPDKTNLDKKGNASLLFQWKGWFEKNKAVLEVMENGAGERMLEAPLSMGAGLSNMRLYYTSPGYVLKKVTLCDLEIGARTDPTLDNAPDPAQDSTELPYYMNRVEFYYDTIRRQEPASRDDYYSPYLRFRNGKATLKESAADYQLIDQLSSVH